MSNKLIPVYLIRLGAKVQVVFVDGKASNALAFEDEFNRRPCVTRIRTARPALPTLMARLPRHIRPKGGK